MVFAFGFLSLAPRGRRSARDRSRPLPAPEPGLRPANSPGPRVPARTRGRLASPAALLAGAAIGLAWLVPETFASTLLGWVGAFLLVFAVRARRAYLPAYGCGLVGQCLGFYWVYGTISIFGGFGAIPSALIFALFVAFGALQFLLFALIHHHLGPLFEPLALRAPTALVLSEFLALRVFRWHYGHTQIAFTPFVQVADLGGALLVSFLMFWVAEAGVRILVFRERRRAFLLPVALFGLALGYGVARIRAYSPATGEAQEVVLVQGNISLAERLDIDAARRNLERLHDLSRSAERPNALIVWPEGSIPAYVPADVGSARAEPALPFHGDGSAFLLGAYSFLDEARRYNAAFAIHPNGNVPPPYFKQVLIPFGEYMPFASIFPWLKSMNNRAGVFSAGDAIMVFEYPMRRRDGTAYRLRVSPLICYEDTIPALSRRAALGGAELLVNLTNDAWFGHSAAPYQHHLIAAFRALENRRFLVRVTNTGLSAVVDPLGKTIARLPLFSRGTSLARVTLIPDQTIYARFVGERPWWILLAASIAAVVAGRRRDRDPNGPLRARQATHALFVL